VLNVFHVDRKLARRDGETEETGVRMLPEELPGLAKAVDDGGCGGIVYRTSDFVWFGLLGEDSMLVQILSEGHGLVAVICHYRQIQNLCGISHDPPVLLEG
jgi:hypothetical protein